MKRTTDLMVCMVLGLTTARASAQHLNAAQYSDPRTPQGTLRSFAAALTQGDLAKATALVAGASPAANFPEIEAAMRKTHTRYGINHLQIAQNDDVATVSFFLAVDALPDKSTYVSWAVLHSNFLGRWEIDAQRTLGVSNSLDPFSALVSLLGRQQLPGEARGDLELQGSKLLRLGSVLQTFVANQNGQFALDNSGLRPSLLPYFPALDVLMRPGHSKNAAISFNSKLKGVTLKNIRFPGRTVMLYEGENGQLNFGHRGRAAVTFVAGDVRYLSPEQAKKLLLWTP